ncbi:MAG: permease [Sandaracinaceae bacterium]|nr:permease [Sandaracinaceae bacterium]
MLARHPHIRTDRSVHQPRRPDARRAAPPVLATLAGGLMGFAFPVCECGVVPVTRRLYRGRLPTPVGIAFLLASPVINPIVIASTYAAFHARASDGRLPRVAVALVVAVLIGLLFGLHASPGAPAARARSPRRHRADGAGRCRAALALAIAAGATSPPRAAVRADGADPGLRHALSLAAEEFFEMGRYLILGSMLAAGLRL